MQGKVEISGVNTAKRKVLRNVKTWRQLLARLGLDTYFREILA